jgi:glutamine---fructose-6-phosphate transaminase (isomerizing)
VISNSRQLLDLDQGLELPPDLPGWLAPLVTIIPAQLYTYHLTRAKGLDTEQPRSIRKVTSTR